MEFLYDYMKNIALFIIFSSFAELIIPDAKYKTYIKTAVGFILILIVLQPIMKFFNSNENIQFEYVQNQLDKISAENSISSKGGSDIIRKNYVENLNSQLSKIIGGLCTVEKSEIKLLKDKFEIDKIEITVIPIEKEKSFFRIEKMKTEEEKINAFILELKKLISDFYNLNVDNIHIIVRKN